MQNEQQRLAVPIVIANKTLLDGHHRMIASILLNKPINVIDVYEDTDKPLNESIQFSENKSNGFKELSLIQNGDTISKITYSTSPITTFTADKNPDDFINIEMMETKPEYRKKGYASKLIKIIKDKYPDKQIIASSNELSKNIFEAKHYDINIEMMETKPEYRKKGYKSIFETTIGPVYHGTKKKFDKFDHKFTSQGVFWFSSDKEKILKGESGAQSSNEIISAYINIKKMAGWNEYEKLSLYEIENLGFDGIKLDDNYIVFEPEQIQVIKN
jgi:GNAT superfamily N-acetyltransferase